MKRLLIITDLVQSSPRFPGISDYLYDVGWYATIVTPPVPGLRSVDSTNLDPTHSVVVETAEYPRKSDPLHQIARTFSNGYNLDSAFWKVGRSGYHGLRRLYELIVDQIIWYPDGDKHWLYNAIATCTGLLENIQFHAVLSSSSPVTSHLIARSIHLASGLPWIADLRDLWTQNHVYRFSRIRRSIERRLEIATLIDSSTMVTVSRPLVENLRGLHHGSRVVEIQNGFDPRWYHDNQVTLSDKFTITYTGRIYPGKQNPSLILVALRDLIYSGVLPRDLVRLRFFGPSELSIDWESQSLGIADIVEQFGMISRETVTQRQRESQLLLLFNWEDSSQRGGILMQKTFDYIGAKRPILATGGHRGDLRESFLTDGNCGAYCPTLSDVKKSLQYWFGIYRDNGSIPYRGSDSFVSRYSYRRRAAELGRELDLLSTNAHQRS